MVKSINLKIGINKFNGEGIVILARDYGITVSLVEMANDKFFKYYTLNASGIEENVDGYLITIKNLVEKLL
jgi:hypothetical protein